MHNYRNYEAYSINRNRLLLLIHENEEKSKLKRFFYLFQRRNNKMISFFYLNIFRDVNMKNYLVLIFKRGVKLVVR